MVSKWGIHLRKSHTFGFCHSLILVVLCPDAPHGDRTSHYHDLVRNVLGYRRSHSHHAAPSYRDACNYVCPRADYGPVAHRDALYVLGRRVGVIGERDAWPPR